MEFRVTDFEAYVGHHRIYVEGVRPEMETGRPPILFVGGAFDGSWICRQQLDCWASRGFPSYALNLRGYYKSRCRSVASLGYRDYLDDIRAVCDHLRLDRPICAGFSIGGILMQKYVESHGARALILYDSDWPRGVARMIGEKADPSPRLPPVMNFWPTPAIVEEMMGMRVSREQFRSLLEYFKHSFLSGRAWRELEIDRIDVDAAKITCPVLVVGVSPRDRAQAALARYYNASRLIFEGYSHGSILISRFHFPVTKRIAAWLEAGFSRGVEELHRRGDKAIEHDKRRRMKLYYFTGWKEPKIHLCDRRGNELSQLAMTRYRPGRFSGEALFEADVPLGEGEKFFLTGGSMEDRPYRGGYYEPAGRRLYLMDGEFFPRLPGKFRKAPTYLVREFPSRKLAHTFRINIMLPRNYGKGEHGPYPVAVLNDGQNQWKNQGAYGGWHTDAIAHDKARRGRCRELVLVSIVSHPRRDQSYLPPPMGRADLYVDFLADRLLPALRKEFALSEQPGEIALIGASYAANCALYAGLKRPDVFGLVGSLSYGRTPNDPVMRRMDALRALPIRRLYIDCGTRWAYDQPHKDDHTDTTRELILLARAKGMTPGKDLLGVIAEGHFHNEFFWRKRIGRCLEFLFPLV